MKKTFLYLSLILLTACGTSRYVNRYEATQWPVTLPQHPPDKRSKKVYNNAQIAPGTIYFNNQDAVSGWIKLVPYHPELKHTIKIPIIKSQDTDDERISRVGRENIDSIRIFPSKPDRHGTALFVPVVPMKFWRAIAVRNQTGIYVPRFIMALHDKYYPYIILYSEGQKHTILKRFFHGDVKGKHIRHALVKFIRHRYGIHKRVNDFKDEHEMFNFILDQEEIRNRHLSAGK
ncbi:hypothetical protein [Chitinophaga sp. Cy-1792]|uniref:hypothetical protein n=1 Tax=Chitinophaga sp. Cy-1792 TaxID=2608339 RepID=UPI0014232C26|nr:hypothetical protein [Chitinophaga sp. Cy-1792]NIG54546.1 hypothetical protein [Chitinophaga sp. Cy-1792]